MRIMKDFEYDIGSFMSNLYDAFLAMGDVCYYEGNDIDPIENCSNTVAWQYIEEYIRLGGKSILLDFNYSFRRNLVKNGKHIHTVSMYYLGCLLEDIVANPLKDISKSLSIEWYFFHDFKYYWFLASLYHDIAHVIEKEINIKVIDYDSCLQEYSIINNVYDHIWKAKSDYKYDKDLIENYFNYIKDCRKHNEHGILAGHLLYDRLMKNYDNSWKDLIGIDGCNGNTYDHFIHKGKTCRIEHKDIYAIVANAIIGHNIWYSDDKPLYNKYHLEKLLKDKSNKIKFNDYPLLVFLAVIDTIEPIKYFTEKSENKDPKYIWENISIEYNESSKEIVINMINKIDKYKCWFKNIKTLEDWIDVEVIADGDKKITIKIN